MQSKRLLRSQERASGKKEAKVWVELALAGAWRNNGAKGDEMGFEERENEEEVVGRRKLGGTKIIKGKGQARQSK